MKIFQRCGTARFSFIVINSILIVYGLVACVALVIGYSNRDLTLCQPKVLIIGLSEWLYWGGLLFYISMMFFAFAFFFDTNFGNNFGKCLSSFFYFLIITNQLCWLSVGIIAIASVPNGCKHLHRALWDMSISLLIFEFIGIFIVTARAIILLCIDWNNENRKKDQTRYEHHLVELEETK